MSKNLQTEIELNDKQLIAYDLTRDNTSPVTDIFYGGGAGGGKSFLGSLFLFLGARDFPESRWMLGGEELKNIKDTTLVSMMTMFKDFELRAGRDYKYNPNDGEVKLLKTGSIIKLVELKWIPSDPEFDRLGSMEFTGAFIDQAEKLVKKAYNVTRTRIRYKTKQFGIKPITFVSCNPHKGWIYDTAYKPYVKGKLKPFRAFIPALVTDNPKIDPAYIRNLQNLEDEAMKQRLLFGNWDYEDNDKQLINAIWYDYSLTDIFPIEGLRKVGVDVSNEGKDKTVFTLLIDDTIADIKEVAVDVSRQADISGEIADALIDYCSTWNVGYENVNVDGVGNGAGVIHACNGRGFYVNTFKATFKPTEASTPGKITEYGNMRDQAYWEFRIGLQTRAIKIWSGIKFSEKLKKQLTAHDYSTQSDKYVKVQEKDEVKKKIGESPDFADSATIARINLSNTQNNAITVTTNIYGSEE